MSKQDVPKCHSFCCIRRNFYRFDNLHLIFIISKPTSSSLTFLLRTFPSGEKASLAAKSAVHGCLHYLNKTIFNDTKPFEELVVKEGSETNISVTSKDSSLSENRILNTREVFVCLLRAFSCAHELILENKGMLTTLTVAVVLPLKPKNVSGKAEDVEEEYKKYDRDRQFLHDDQRSPRSERAEHRYVCCVCNVGDTLAYVYSQKYGVRELTKGSHDINCNRDMRDALGALGPVDGINPELSNLTLSITTLQRGDIVFVASDGLTDNFDPNVCRFSVNCAPPEAAARAKRAPVKPPRKAKGEGAGRSAEDSNPLVAEFMKENALDAVGKKQAGFAENRASSLRKQAARQAGSQVRGSA